MSSGGGGGLNLFGKYFSGGGSGRTGSNREPANLPKILRSTVDTGREVNVIEAKTTRSQPKKTVVSTVVSSPFTRSQSPARAFTPTPTSSPLLQKRMKFNINVTPSKVGGGSSTNPLKQNDINGNRVYVNKSSAPGAGGDMRCSIDVVKAENKGENKLAHIFGSKNSSSKQTPGSSSGIFTRNKENSNNSGLPANFAVNVNLALNMERSDVHEEVHDEIDTPRAIHKDATNGYDHAHAASTSLEDIYSDPMTAESSAELSPNRSHRLSTSVDTASALKVAVRMRPLSAAEVATNPKPIDILMKADQVVMPNRKEYFKFDHCLNSSDRELFNYADQEMVYRRMGEPLLEYAFRGYNTCLFAYGQSGSGKTYTMMGSEQVPGIIPRFLNDLFKRIGTPRSAFLSPSSNSTNTEYIVNISFMEIYNEKIHDLLVDQFDAIVKGPLKVREHPETGPFVEDLTVYTVENYEQALELLTTGNERRTTASTAANETSSRSHSIFSVILVQNKTVVADTVNGGDGYQESTTSTTISKIHLVDLAGSERALAVSAAKDRQREGNFINKSLLTLGKVITMLAGPGDGDGQKTKSKASTQPHPHPPHIPYRDSVLTFLLKDSLGGNSRTSMIATISPAKEHMEETISTLKYASTASRIVNVVHVNEDPKMKIINGLLKQISFLKREVESATAAAATAASASGPKSPVKEQQQQTETTPVEQKEDKEEAITVNVNQSQEKENTTTEDAYSSVSTSLPAPTVYATNEEGYCSGICKQQITVKLEQLDGKFNQLLQNQKSFQKKLEVFVETVVTTSPSTSASSKNNSRKKSLQETLPVLPSFSSNKVVDELKSLLAKVKSESTSLTAGSDKHFDALMKNMESVNDYEEDSAGIEVPRKEKKENELPTTAPVPASASSWGGTNKPMISKPMNAKDKRAAEVALKVADAAKKRQEKEAEEAEARKKAEEAKLNEEKEAEAKRKAEKEEAEARKKAEAAKLNDEKEAEVKRKAEKEEAEARKKAEEAKLNEEKEAEAKRKAEKEEEEARKKAEEAKLNEEKEAEAKRKAEKEEEEAKQKAEEAKLNEEKEAEAKRKAEKEEEEARKKAEKEKAEEEEDEKEEAEAKQKGGKETKKAKQKEAKEAKQKAEKEAREAKQKAAKEAKEAKQKAKNEARKAKQKEEEEEETKQEEEEEEEAKQKTEEAEAKQKAEKDKAEEKEAEKKNEVKDAETADKKAAEKDEEDWSTGKNKKGKKKGGKKK